MPQVFYNPNLHFADRNYLNVRNMIIGMSSYPNVAQALIAFALETSRAAHELETAARTGEPLSNETQRIIAVWQNGAAQAPHYLHPTVEAIEQDGETKTFAIITAMRAMRDAIAHSHLSPELQVRAALRLAHQLAPAHGGEFYVESIASIERQDRAAIPSDDVVMRTVGKALVMASTAAREPLRPEMVDFIGHAERLFNGPRLLGVDLADGVDQTVIVKVTDTMGQA